MTPSVLAIIGVTIVFSSFLSGVFGMAGGMILLGVLLNYFDVATGMILFSIIQFFSNGWRVVQWRQYVLWPIFGWYLVGAVISFAIMWAIGPAILLAIGGTSLAPIVIERMTDHGFRQWTRAIIFAISAVYLVRAGWLLWHG